MVSYVSADYVTDVNAAVRLLQDATEGVFSG